MSRNLCRDDCVQCGYTFTLADFRGKPLEFRKYYRYNPTWGVKLVCPDCGKVYFGWIRYDDKFWSKPEDALKDRLGYGGDSWPNENKDKFVIECVDHKGQKCLQDIGYYTIDLSYYESYNDEGDGVDCADPVYIWLEADYPLGRWRNPGRSYIVNGEYTDKNPKEKAGV